MQDNPDIMTQHEIAERLGTTGVIIGRWYGLAYVRNEPGTPTKLYSLSRVCQIMTEQAGNYIEPKHLPDLITRADADEILAAAGLRRSGPTWRKWAQQGVGPRQYRVGGTLRYLRFEITAWAEYLKHQTKKVHPRDMFPNPIRQATS
jgi:hypothetical protein